MIAAIMTAANLGSRLTGWGFVIFTIGAAGWCIDAVLTGQQNLFWSNAFLGVVDMIGVYRWLGQRAKLEDGAQAAVEKSRTNPKPLFPILSLDGRAIDGDDDVPVAHVVGAMGECESGRIAYLVVRGARTGDGADTALRAISWDKIEAGEAFRTALSPSDIARLPVVDADDWPESASGRAPRPDS